jgi:hypothetical protein
MFEIFITIIGIVLTSYLLDKAIDRESNPSEADAPNSFEVEIEELNGIWYCWCKDEEDGYSFVGQSKNKEDLEEQFLKFVKQKYQPS